MGLHSLRSDRFGVITAGGVLGRVLAGIQAAKQNGLRPLKLNAVIIRGWNEDEIVDLANLPRGEDVSMRFIEYMPFDSQRFWGIEKVIGGQEII